MDCEKLILASKLRNHDFLECWTILTAKNIYTRDEISQIKLIRTIDLLNVIFVYNVDDLITSPLPAKYFDNIKKEVSRSLPEGKHGFIISSIKRCGNNKWRINHDLFWCSSQSECIDWISAIRSSVHVRTTYRPNHLLVFINPSSGKRRAKHIYSVTIAPLFRLAAIETQVIVTTHRGQVTEHLQTHPLDQFDGVVCVGGDGFLAEAVQGLLLRERASAGLALFENHRPNEVELPTSLRLGVIPAGSTDTVIFSTQGTNDVLTAALHIIIGDEMFLDAAAVFAGEEETFVRYTLSMLGYGFHADLLRDDDKLRWMGPKRYDYSGFSTLLSLAAYNGEISFLPSANRSSHPTDGVLCSTGCSVCSMSSLPSPSDRFSDASVKENDAKAASDTVTFFVKDAEKRHSADSLNEIHPKSHQHSCLVLESRARFSHPPGALHLLRSPSWTVQGCPEGWCSVRDSFVAVNAFVQSCRCPKATHGPAPCAHLGDGCLDLVLVQNCSRRQFLQYLLSVAKGQDCDSHRLPFVRVQRVCALRFKALPHASDRRGVRKTGKSVWCSDGEIIPHSDVAVYVHRQLIRFFARGPELIPHPDPGDSRGIQSSFALELLFQSAFPSQVA